MNTGTLEVRYGNTVLEITPEWFVISSEYTEDKYICETKDAYPRNMLEFVRSDKDNNIIIENDTCWHDYLDFCDSAVNNHFQCLVAAYVNGWIEEYLAKYWSSLLFCNIDAKYIE